MPLPDDHQLSVVEEALRVAKRVRERRVVVRITSEEQDVPIQADLTNEEIAVERIDVSRRVEAPERPRQEGDVLIVPIHEEQLLVHKQLVVVAELRIRRTEQQSHHEQTVKLHKERVSVDREPLPADSAEAAPAEMSNDRQRHPKGENQ